MYLRRVSLIPFLLLALVGCEGPMGPEGPMGQPGAQGPQGPQGVGYTFWSVVKSGTYPSTVVTLPTEAGSVTDPPNIQAWIRIGSSGDVWLPIFDGWNSADVIWVMEARTDGGINLIFIGTDTSDVIRVDLSY